MLDNNVSEPDSLQREDLEDITAQCPSEGGDAVFQAHALLHSVYSIINCTEEAIEERGYFTPLTNDNTTSMAFSIYPNPSKGAATLKLNLNEPDAQADFILYDALGRPVWRRTHLTSGTHNLDLQGLAPGVYYYQAYSNNTSIGTGNLTILP